MVKSHREDIEKIINMIHNSILAEAIYKSFELGINNRHVRGKMQKRIPSMLLIGEVVVNAALESARAVQPAAYTGM